MATGDNIAMTQIEQIYQPEEPSAVTALPVGDVTSYGTEGTIGQSSRRRQESTMNKTRTLIGTSLMQLPIWGTKTSIPEVVQRTHLRQDSQ